MSAASDRLSAAIASMNAAMHAIGDELPKDDFDALAALWADVVLAIARFVAEL